MFNKENPKVEYQDYNDSLEIIWSDDFFKNYHIYTDGSTITGFSIFKNKYDEVIGLCVHEITKIIEKSKELKEQRKKDHEGLSFEELTNKIFDERTFGPKVYYSTYNDGSDMLYVSWHKCTEDCDCETFEDGANIEFRDRCNGVGYVECDDRIDAIHLYGVANRMIKKDPARGLIKDEKETWKEYLRYLEEDQERRRNESQ